MDGREDAHQTQLLKLDQRESCVDLGDDLKEGDFIKAQCHTATSFSALPKKPLTYVWKQGRGRRGGRERRRG